jgi:hypothetical protein
VGTSIQQNTTLKKKNLVHDAGWRVTKRLPTMIHPPYLGHFNTIAAAA